MRHQMIPGLVIISLSLAAATALSMQQPAGKTVVSSPAHDCSPVAELHNLMQQRFSAMDRFGIRRVITSPYHLQHFTPENQAEKNVVADLEQSGWTVSFYLAGRSVLEAKPDKSLWAESPQNFYARKPINHPILLTKNAKFDELPNPLELWDQTRAAMAAFRRTGQYDFSIGIWQVAARPIRASQEACLKCHAQRTVLIDGQPKVISQQLNIGDPLGAVLYVYRRAR